MTIGSDLTSRLMQVGDVAIHPTRSLRIYMGILTLLLLSVAVAVPGQDSFWHDTRGNPLPDTNFRKSLNGMAARLLATSDDNWQEKWNAPSETVPQFIEADTVPVGGQLRILTFIGNPARSADGTHVTCDFSMQKPDGTYSIQEQDVECLNVPLGGSQRTFYLSRLVIGFSGEKADPPGKWTVRVTVKDLVKPTTIPLETSFVLK